MNAAKRHQELCESLRAHNYQYYVLDTPSVSDAEYDVLFNELKGIEKEFPELVTPSSPSQRVGAAPKDGFKKVTRGKKMYSLDNAYDDDEIRSFDRRIRETLGDESYRYVAEPKIDGASIECTYEDGNLVLASTRGDGQTGEDVTANIRTVPSVPLTISEKRTMIVRGEVFIYQTDLDTINEQRQARGEQLFANTRNASSGSLRLLDPKLTAQRPLRIHFYDLVQEYWDRHTDMLKALADMGLPTHRAERVCNNVDELIAYIKEFETIRESLPYDTDGIVLKVDEIPLRNTLGFTARFPRWATAYKYAAEKAETVLHTITCDLGRTGAITPVANLEPVQLSGTTVARASLHNIDMIAEKDIREGDTVLIQKAGEIIPQVLSVVLGKRPKGAQKWVPPTTCPVCEKKVTQSEGEAALRCTNPLCEGRLKAGVWHMTRRSAMDIDNLGKSLIEQLVDAGLVSDLADVFALKDKRKEILALDRMGEKSVDKVLKSIENARKGRPFDKLLTGLGIPLVGTVAAKLIAEKYSTLPTMLAETSAKLEKDLETMDGIGPKMAKSVSDFFADDDIKAILNKFLALGVEAVQPKPKAKAVGALSGMSFCVTGSFDRKRNAIHDEIEANGGEVHKSVKKGTTYLLTGEKVGQTKMDAAVKKGAKVIGEDAYKALFTAK